MSESNGNESAIVILALAPKAIFFHSSFQQILDTYYVSWTLPCDEHTR